MATLQSVLHKLEQGTLPFDQGPTAFGLIVQRIDQLKEEIQPLSDSTHQLETQVQDLTQQLAAAPKPQALAELQERLELATQQLAAAPKLADLEKLVLENTELLRVREQFTTKDLQQTELVQHLQEQLEAAPKLGDLQQLQEQLQAARQVLEACKGIFGCEDGEVVGHIQALQDADAGQLAQIAGLPGMPVDGGTTLVKVQAVIAQAAKLQHDIQPLRDRAGVLEQVKQSFAPHVPEDHQVVARVQALQGRVAILERIEQLVHKNDPEVVGQIQANLEGVHIVINGLFPHGRPGGIFLDNIREELARLKQRDIILQRAEAHLPPMDGQPPVDLAQRVREKNRELADEQSFTGTVWRVVNGIVNGFVSTLKFFFVSLPTYVIDTLRYLGGVFAR